MLVGLSLIVLIVFNPCRLKHSLERDYGHLVLFVLLVHFAHLLVDYDCLLVIVGIFHEISQILQNLHGFVPKFHFLQEHGQHKSMLDAQYILIKELNDRQIRINCEKSLLPVLVTEEKVGLVETGDEKIDNLGPIMVLLDDPGDLVLGKPRQINQLNWCLDPKRLPRDTHVELSQFGQLLLMALPATNQ